MIFAGVQRNKRRRLSGRQREKERKKETRIDLSVHDIQTLFRYKFEGYKMCLCTHSFENYTTVICSSIFNCCD